ncbi:MAG: MATE family efflux transporter [Clostridia bacterium]|nr:MATE family efflux transporter [Clostridia bacterium]
MRIKLSDHFTIKKLLQATLPTITMMVFISIYSIVDGVFIANFAGASAFSGINLIFPVIMIIGAVGFMLGTGGSALVSNLLGEGKKQRANQVFTMTLYFTIILGVVLSVVIFLLIEPLTHLMVKIGGQPVSQEMIDSAIVYGRILTVFQVAFMVQNYFQSLFVVAEKANLGFGVTVIAGCCNMVLDALFVGLFKWGVVGAAVATGISYCVGAVVPIVYFAKDNPSLLKFASTKLELAVLGQASLNGSSEFVSNVAASIISILFNVQLLKYIGEKGVAAYGVICYAGFIFSAIFFGYIMGTAPAIGYHNGAKNHAELKSLLKKSLLILAVFSVVIVTIVQLFARPLSSIFANGDKELLDITTHGFKLYGWSFMLSGFCIFSSGFFTALNDGLTSAIVSFLRTLVFQIIFVWILPLVWGLNGIWLSIVVAEVCSIVVCFVCFVVNRKKYQYA